MRTHQPSSNNSSKKGKAVKGNRKKIALYTAVLCTAIAVITLAIVLPLTLGQTYDPYDNGGHYVEQPNPPEPPQPPPQPAQFVVPMENFELGKTASLNRLVFHPTLNHWRTHNGVNFTAPEGTVVRSMAAGTVVSVEHTQLEATIVTIQHANGLISSYQGLATNVTVEEGETVSAGTPIGSVAPIRPIARSEGSHMHLRTRVNGNLVDPLTFFPELAGEK